MSEETIIKAVYEAKCEQIQSTWLNKGTRDFVVDAYAYASSKRLFPCYQVDTDVEDCFATAYNTDEHTVTEIIKEFDKIWLSNNKDDAEFYKVEPNLVAQGIDRMDIVHTLRYCYLSNVFDADFYKTVMRNAPSEALGITRDLKELEISIP